MYAARRVDGNAVRMGKDHAGGAQRRKGLSVANSTGAHSRGGVVARAAHHGRTLGQAGQGGSFRRHRSGHVHRLVHPAQQRRSMSSLFSISSDHCRRGTSSRFMPEASDTSVANWPVRQ